MLSGDGMEREKPPAQLQGNMAPARASGELPGPATFSEDLRNLHDMIATLKTAHKGYADLKAKLDAPCATWPAMGLMGSPAPAECASVKTITGRINEIKIELVDRLDAAEGKWRRIWGPEKLARESANWFKDDHLNDLDPMEAAMKYFSSIMNCWDKKARCWRDEQCISQAALYGAYYDFYLIRVEGNPDAISKEEAFESAIRNLANLVRDEMILREKNGLPPDSLSLPRSIHWSRPAGTF